MIEVWQLKPKRILCPRRSPKVTTMVIYLELAYSKHIQYRTVPSRRHKHDQYIG